MHTWQAADGRPGADFLNVLLGKYGTARYSCLSAGQTGIQVVPRSLFALKSMDFGAFFHSVLKNEAPLKTLLLRFERIFTANFSLRKSRNT